MGWLGDWEMFRERGFSRSRGGERAGGVHLQQRRRIFALARGGAFEGETEGRIRGDFRACARGNLLK